MTIRPRADFSNNHGSQKMYKNIFSNFKRKKLSTYITMLRNLIEQLSMTFSDKPKLKVSLTNNFL